MGKKVWTTLLILLVGALVAYNIIKFFFPDLFLMCLTDTNILALGNFIEERAWLIEVYYYVSSGIIFYLFGCIAAKRWYLRFWETVYVLTLNVVSQLLYVYVPEITAFAGILTMLAIPLVIGDNAKGFIVAFLTHSLCQHLVIFVRGYLTILPVLNMGAEICLFIESLIIIFCFYVINNIKERKDE